MSQHLDIPSLMQLARPIIDEARRLLGADLGGFSRLDLLADNIPYASLDDLRKVIALIDLSEAETVDLCRVHVRPNCPECDGAA